MNSYSLQNQSALVTGADSGIGKGVALELAKAGSRLLVNYAHNQAAADEVVAEIKAAGGEAFAYQADVSHEGEVQAMFAELYKQYGTIDILVNNAGLQKDSKFVDMTLDQWQTVININLTGQFLCSREAAREFIRRGVIEGVSRAAGKIICMSSVHEVIPWGGHVNYATSKGGVMMLMKSMAQELAPHKIRVVSIGPGA
ncbi:MAG: SDR family NAD(P)-dependent oxidoreductase, partial [Mucilaginibacter sp.]